MSKHSWQGHFGPDVVSRSWPGFAQVEEVVPVSSPEDSPNLAAWAGPNPLLGAGVVAGAYARAKSIAKVLGGRPVGPHLVYRPYLKLTTFVPANALDRVREAVILAGAGQSGSYTYCTFSTNGTGTFKPGPEAKPYIGKPGRLEYIEEFRLETILPSWMQDEVVTAMLVAHPYQDVMYDLYALDNRLTVPQAYLSDDGIVRTAEVTADLGAWAISTGVTQFEAEVCEMPTRLELARKGIRVTLVPLGTWTVPGLQSILTEVRPH